MSSQPWGVPAGAGMAMAPTALWTSPSSVCACGCSCSCAALACWAGSPAGICCAGAACPACAEALPAPSVSRTAWGPSASGAAAGAAGSCAGGMLCEPAADCARGSCKVVRRIGTDCGSEPPSVAHGAACSQLVTGQQPKTLARGIHPRWVNDREDNTSYLVRSARSSCLRCFPSNYCCLCHRQ